MIIKLDNKISAHLCSHLYHHGLVRNISEFLHNQKYTPKLNTVVHTISKLASKKFANASLQV